MLIAWTQRAAIGGSGLHTANGDGVTNTQSHSMKCFFVVFVFSSLLFTYQINYTLISVCGIYMVIDFPVHRYDGLRGTLGRTDYAYLYPIHASELAVCVYTWRL